jgi:farnesyl-diphosphate farnesyltransferase
MNSATLREVAHIFRSYSRKIHQKASPADPNYHGICAMWEKIDAWVEQHYPSSSPSRKALGGRKQEYSAGDRYHDLQLEAQRARGGDIADLTDVKELWMERRGMERVESRMTRWQWFTFIGGARLFLFVIVGVSVWGILYFAYGESWAWEDISAISERMLGGAAGRFSLIG